MKTIKQVSIIPVYSELLPEETEFGKLYISHKYKASFHQCLCGCGHGCFLPLDAKGWKLIENQNGSVSLTPSILQRFDCKSHYIITKNVANFV